jgi:RNA polymerase subunit RPABC4/transcription elongation factor Spt4
MHLEILILKVVFMIPLMFFLYRDSRARDYSWMLWTMLPITLLFSNNIGFTVFLAVGIIATYFILRPKGTILKCPKCGKPIHEMLTVCPFCRREAKRECLQCHEPVPWEADQCPFCKSRSLTKG